jgi:hypothetical protein
VRNNPKSNGSRYDAVVAGWEEHAPDAAFGGLTLAQFKAKVKPSFDARAEIDTLSLKLDAARVDRDNADADSGSLADNVVNSVKGDPPSVKTARCTPRSATCARVTAKSGLTRAAKKLVAQPELKIAA